MNLWTNFGRSSDVETSCKRAKEKEWRANSTLNEECNLSEDCLCPKKTGYLETFVSRRRRPCSDQVEILSEDDQNYCWKIHMKMNAFATLKEEFIILRFTSLCDKYVLKGISYSRR